MIYTLTLNTSVDLMIGLERFVEGSVNSCETAYKLPGGKGINVSIVLNKLGHDSTALGFVGGVTGKFIVNELKNMKILCDFVEVEGDTRTNIKMKDSLYESEINGISPEISKINLEDLLRKLKGIKRGDVLVIGGSIPKSLSEDIYMKIVTESVGNGVRVAVDGKNKALAYALKGKPFVVKPNVQELGSLFGVKIEHKDEIIRYGRKVVEMGAENVIVSMAGDGAMLINKNKEVYIGNVPKGILVNSVGAGDSLVGGFIAGQIEGLSLTESFKKGIAAGSASAYSKKLCTLQEVEQILDEIIIEKL